VRLVFFRHEIHRSGFLERIAAGMRALLSVYDKTGIVEFARALVDIGFELISTGGTLKTLQDAGFPAIAVSDVTGFPEILDGRVKTLHPAIHGGLLARRELPDHMRQLSDHDIEPIDLLTVNLYPFAETVRQPGVTDEAAIEQIDVGGPAMLRAASKNYQGVVVVSDPSDYGSVVKELKSDGLSISRRRALAAKGFAHVAAYDTIVAEYLRSGCDEEVGFPQELTLGGAKVADLRYGENPQQRAAAYRCLVAGTPQAGILDARQLGGKELSFNNLLDADAALVAIRAFQSPAVSIIKHTIPCGLAMRPSVADAFAAALAGDPVSAFGGIVALNRSVDANTAQLISEVFFEVIVAPAFDEDALEILGRKKQLRLLELPNAMGSPTSRAAFDVRPITGGMLVQEEDFGTDNPSSWNCVTTRAPSEPEKRDLQFAWEAVRHVKSNAIVLAKDQAVVGVGSGQPNRVESVRIAVRKAGDRAKGAVLASDAFFPFPDSLEEAAQAGVSAVVQPGGSVRDEEVIGAAIAANVAMLFTGIRHFKH
jgi:phosphoribosylaminoimidazolecarboxamide formyltransferase/IMP cyclohydrolase